MAQRRMFSKDITNSSDFQMMSHSAQSLYFHIGMNADDDGFCELFTVVRMTETKPDDIKALHERGLIYVVDEKVAIVKDWHENNNIQNDRYKQSKYLNNSNLKELYSIIMEEKIKNLKRYEPLLTNRIQNVSKMDTQVRLGKVRLNNTNTRESAKKIKELEIDNSIIEKLKQKGFPEQVVDLEIKKFISYWTEPNQRGKQRWQGQKFFDVSRRLATWFSRIAERYNNNQSKNINLDNL